MARNAWPAEIFARPVDSTPFLSTIRCTVFQPTIPPRPQIPHRAGHQARPALERAAEVGGVGEAQVLGDLLVAVVPRPVQVQHHVLAHLVVHRLEMRQVFLQLALAGGRADAHALGEPVEAQRVAGLALQHVVGMLQNALAEAKLLLLAPGIALHRLAGGDPNANDCGC